MQQFLDVSISKFPNLGQGSGVINILFFLNSNSQHFPEEGGGTVGSDVTLRQNRSVFIRCRTMAVGAALAL